MTAARYSQPSPVHRYLISKNPYPVKPSPIPASIDTVSNLVEAHAEDHDHRGEHLRTDTLQPLAPHRFRHDLLLDVGGLPRRVRRGLSALRRHHQTRRRPDRTFISSSSRLQRCAPGSVAWRCHPGVEPAAGHTQQSCHAGDFDVGLVHRHQVVAFFGRCLVTKKATAFPRNTLSLV